MPQTLSSRFEPQAGAASPWYNGTLVDALDVYFALYDTDFRGALAAYASIMGPMELPPQSAFGVWWSLYYNFSQDQFVDEVLECGGGGGGMNRGRGVGYGGVSW